MEQMLIVHISSLSTIIILSIVLLVNSIKTKNKLIMYLSIGSLVVSIGCLTYCLIHHFNDEHYKNKVKQLFKNIAGIANEEVIKDDGTEAKNKKELKDCYYNKKTIKLASDIFKTFGVTTEELDRDINDINATKNLSNLQNDYLNAVLNTISEYCNITTAKDFPK